MPSIESVGGWTIDEIIAAAEHAQECKPKDCRGRYPDYNECSVADLCKGVLELVDKYDAMIASYK